MRPVMPVHRGARGLTPDHKIMTVLKATTSDVKDVASQLEAEATRPVGIIIDEKVLRSFVNGC